MPENLKEEAILANAAYDHPQSLISENGKLSLFVVAIIYSDQ